MFLNLLYKKEERMENQNEIRFKWLHGQNSLVFFLVGIIIVLCSFLNRNIERTRNSERRVSIIISEHLFTLKENEKLKIENNEVNRLKFKEEYYAKKNDNLSRCLDAAWKYGQKYPKITPTLIMNIQYNESRHNPYAISPKGAIGVMQIMYSVWHSEFDIDISKMQEIDYNTGIGVEILHIYEKENNGNMIDALRQYNAGARKHLAGEYAYDTLKSENIELKLVRSKNTEIKAL